MIEQATGPDTEDLDLEERTLCPDETCIGVIGPNGRCKVCGRAADVAGAAGPALAEGEEAALAERPEGAAPPEGAEAEDDFADRRLCPDGACIGVIGWDDRCKVCGRAE
jgi:hypothetical protein